MLKAVFLQPNGVGDVMDIYLRDRSGRPAAGISLMRSANSRPFSELEVGAVRAFHAVIELSVNAGFFGSDKRQEIFGAADLTARERTLMHYLEEGLSNAQIGQKLCISAPIVKTHCNHIFQKLGVANRVELLSRLMRS